MGRKIDSKNRGANNSAVKNCTGRVWVVEKFYRRIREEGEHWRPDSAHSASSNPFSSHFDNAIFCTPNVSAFKVTIAKALEYFNSTRHIILYHEDLIMNLTILEIFKTQEFLKLPQMVLTSQQIKIHKGPFSDHFKNKTLTATAYESFLHAKSFGCNTTMEF